MPFTANQERDICTLIAAGCDRHVAARCLGVAIAELNALVESDAGFARDFYQAEARAELAHVRNVQQAAQDDKQWRASVWWLERRAPERYAREAQRLTAPKVAKFVEMLAQIIAEEVQHEADRQRLLERLSKVTITGEGGSEP